MITAEEYNARVLELMRHVPLGGMREESGGTDEHHWEVTVSRAEDVRGDSRAWRAYVGPGMVNGRVATINQAVGGVIERRSLFAKPQPSLELTAPSADGSDQGSFRKVSDAQRPPPFRSRAMRELELYRATVIVSGARPTASDLLLEMPGGVPNLGTLIGVVSEVALRAMLASIGVLDLVSTQPIRPPFTVSTVPAPVLANDGTSRYPLATLWLLRGPDGPPADRIEVEQRAFWSLQAVGLMDDGGLLSLLPVLQSAGAVGQITALGLFETLINQGLTKWWSV